MNRFTRIVPARRYAAAKSKASWSDSHISALPPNRFSRRTAISGLTPNGPVNAGHSTPEPRSFSDCYFKGILKKSIVDFVMARAERRCWPIGELGRAICCRLGYVLVRLSPLSSFKPIIHMDAGHPIGTRRKAGRKGDRSSAMWSLDSKCRQYFAHMGTGWLKT